MPRRPALLLPFVAVAVATPLAAQPATRAALTTAAPARGNDAEARALLDRTAAQLQRGGGFRATFTQTIANPILGGSQASAGSYAQRAPGVFAIDFTQPAGDRIVSDGTALWVYVPSATPGQVLRLATGANAPGGVDIVGQFFTAPSQRYTIGDGGSTTLDGAAARIVKLVPREPMGFSKASVWLDPASATLRQLEVTEPSGTVRTIRFTGMERGVAFGANTFRFRAPRGVKVVDPSALR